jgi:hypothetical protein
MADQYAILFKCDLVFTPSSVDIGFFSKVAIRNNIKLNLGSKNGFRDGKADWVLFTTY